MADVTMPKLSDTMEEGKILRWLKRSGDRIEAGEVLAEVETDKADMELEAPASGVLRDLRLAEGETAPVGAVIAVIDDRESAEASAPPAGAAPGPEPGAAAVPAAAVGSAAGRPGIARPAAPELELQGRPPTAAGRTGPRRVAAIDLSAPGESGEPSPPVPSPGPERPPDLDRPKKAQRGEAQSRADEEASRAAFGAARSLQASASAAGRARARAIREAGPVPGTVRVRPPASPGGEGASPAAAPERGAARTHRVPLSRMRASIARRMAESKREAPHFYLMTTVDMERAVELRAALQEVAAVSRGVTFNHLVLKAVADALVAVPELNARFAGDAIEIVEEVNLGVATAVADGLIVPVIHGAERLSLLEIAARSRELAERAATNAFSGDDLSGATFSVSNLGMYGVERFLAVINPPQAAILAVGAVERRPVVRGDGLAVGHSMALTLSCDHRTVDGARAAAFLAEVRRRLENPVTLLLPGQRE